MKVTLLFFGRVQDLTGASKLEFETEGGLDGLRRELTQRWPGLAQQQILWSVNQQVMKGDAALNEGDEIALMPPFAGG